LDFFFHIKIALISPKGGFGHILGGFSPTHLVTLSPSLPTRENIFRDPKKIKKTNSEHFKFCRTTDLLSVNRPLLHATLVAMQRRFFAFRLKENLFFCFGLFLRW
jgi:hypothetical protein